MTTIPITESRLGFNSSVYFHNTGKIRERIVDCSREELIDLAFFYLNVIEKTHGKAEKEVEELEEVLGVNEPFQIR